MRLPRAIAVHPAKGMMFATDWSSYAFIAAASMDGSSFTKIITDRVTWPNALAVDIYSDKIYWADAYNDMIEVANLDGTGRRAIISDSGTVPHVFALAVADDLLYWSDWTYRGLLRASKLTGENVTVVAQTALLPYGLKVFHKSLQPRCEKIHCPWNALWLHSCTAWIIWIIPCTRSTRQLLAPRICLPGQFQCHDNKKCVAPGGLCDGAEDCWDASDEKFCPSGFRSNASSAQLNSMTGR
ncbi:Low-density lipoprotein receptor repeat class B [Ancylostoma ceylanicum]|uniref:Low-density lipoprotein receptor repeat class B n=1 Tax=Ancylostoma ceylanicum TaxID=53326 RepID=A0A0D6M2H7_9BILA|nr:Low-density lipoprotein receptor repeat class B [Ancylostoma ceylanicum]